jgi:hypothetical protein
MWALDSPGSKGEMITLGEFCLVLTTFGWMT